MPENDKTAARGHIDIWEIAKALQHQDEDRLGLPHTDGPLDQDIEEKLSRFDSWEKIAAASLMAMQPIILVERFLNEAYGVSGLFQTAMELEAFADGR